MLIIIHTITYRNIILHNINTIEETGCYQLKRNFLVFALLLVYMQFVCKSYKSSYAIVICNYNPSSDRPLTLLNGTYYFNSLYSLLFTSVLCCLVYKVYSFWISVFRRNLLECCKHLCYPLTKHYVTLSKVININVLIANQFSN